MAIKLKQYLENSWYRWASQDRQSGYAAQFQYWENVNIRDMRNGVCLSWGATDVDTYSSEFSLFTYDWLLLTVDKSWKVKEAGWSLLWDIEEHFNSSQLWTQ